ncbi:MAG: pantetheine-phosphate adenylyltransferase [Lactimicrobium massiliense]|nr:pantetheine-phosphate adenylyltransferase [Lactimicrobium massiliense]MDD6230578.1 pantetheine-phosphate adenylyltransferase [Lactimicrobium massiliense]MDD6560306.1 pantetheine-phosphate adenylyltransferase [Lactimicrobium massiliense]MDD6674931.1 pantetheine-phosphate adenylyltransferase [Lactimicrobium massiliense]
MKAVYSGTFDPITNGHMDIIERASRMFDEVTVLIMRNVNKKCLFTETERRDLIVRSLQTLPQVHNVSVVIGEGLTVDMARQLGAVAIVRGIRAVSDYEYELKQATANMMLNPDIETMLMIARPQYSFLSSSVVKEIALNGGAITGMVPQEIEKEVMQALQEQMKQNQK